MSQPIDQPDASGGQEPAAVENQVCPFCGSINEASETPCPRCRMEDSATTRQATKARIGPWYVLQPRNPAAPGMRFATLLALVKRGQVTPRSVVRGPTTHQLWQFAANIKGLSREFGLCWSCGEKIEPSASICPQCQRMQEPPVYPDVLLESSANPPPAPPRAQPASSPAPATQESQRPDLFDPAPSAPQEKPRPAPAARGGEILSAKELATAFQLDFAPEERPRQARTRQRRRIPVGAVASILLLLAVGAAVAALYFRPDWREQSLDWAIDTYSEVRRWAKSADEIPSVPEPMIAEADEQAPVEIDRAIAAKADAADEPEIAKAPDPPVRSSQSKPDPAPLALAPQTAAPVPSASVPSAPAQPAPIQPAPAAPVQSSPAPVQTVPVQTSPVVSAPPRVEAPKAAPTDPASQLDQARQLWHSAIDAEGRRDFAEAVRLYEQIQDLPREVWPGGLDLRLANARKRL